MTIICMEWDAKRDGNFLPQIIVTDHTLLKNIESKNLLSYKCLPFVRIRSSLFSNEISCDLPVEYKNTWTDIRQTSCLAKVPADLRLEELARETILRLSNLQRLSITKRTM